VPSTLPVELVVAVVPYPVEKQLDSISAIATKSVIIVFFIMLNI
jgi:hypothetical protein